MSTSPRRASNQYKKRPGQPSSIQGPRPDGLCAPSGDRLDALAFGWDSADIDWDVMASMPVEHSVARFQAQLVQHVWDAAALEGNPFTMPEVHELLEGTTVGGHRLEDEKQVLALAESTSTLHGMVSAGTFAVAKEVSDRLHGIVAPHEAIEAGNFRGEGSANGGGHVRLGEYGIFSATGSADGGVALRREYDEGTRYLEGVEHPVERAVAYFCMGARRQFYFDGNKRTARLMMNGQLMQAGFDAISIPFNRRLEFNQHLIVLYKDAEATPLMRFILDCRPLD